MMEDYEIDLMVGRIIYQMKLKYKVKINKKNKHLMGVHQENKEININSFKLRTVAKRKNIGVELLTRLTLAHELGHIDDYEKSPSLHKRKMELKLNENRSRKDEKELYELILQSEMNAWEMGRKYIEKEHIEEYNKLNQKNVKHYIKIISEL